MMPAPREELRQLRRLKISSPEAASDASRFWQPALAFHIFATFSPP